MKNSECSNNSNYEKDNIRHELQLLIDKLGFIISLAMNDYININNK
ncbi:13690_t:CDS:1, partial [Funneliformis caledonium]